MNLRIPKIRELDLRPLAVKVAEHNARPGALQLRIWDPAYFRKSFKSAIRDSKVEWI